MRPQLIRSPVRSAGVTATAIVERESDLSVAGAAVASFDVRKHRVSDRTFPASWEYFGVAEFTSVPDGMLLVREENGLNPRVACLDGEIFSVLHRPPFDGQAIEKIDRLDDSFVLGSLPIHAVLSLRKLRSRCVVSSIFLRPVCRANGSGRTGCRFGRSRRQRLSFRR